MGIFSVNALFRLVTKFGFPAVSVGFDRGMIIGQIRKHELGACVPFAWKKLEFG